MDMELTPSQTGKDKVVDSPTQVNSYSNLTMATVSPEEAALHFGLKRMDDPQIADGVAKIYMSISAFKRLGQVVNQLVGNYEETFGVIKMPLDMLTPEALEKMKKMAENNEGVSDDLPKE